jgi:hypothetical protein
MNGVNSWRAGVSLYGRKKGAQKPKGIECDQVGKKLSSAAQKNFGQSSSRFIIRIKVGPALIPKHAA